jgi:hypothetical protein
MVSLIDILVRLLTGLFFLGVAQPAPVRPVDPPEAIAVPATQSFTTLFAVDVLVMESFPMQVQLQVQGEHGDGCELPVIVEQSREGNTVTVSIYRVLPADTFCPMMLQPYEASLMLDGTFEPGDYVFVVNNLVVEQTL